MSEKYVQVDDKELNKTLAELEKIPRELDQAVKTAALNSIQPLIKGTPHRTGHTARGWLGPEKIAEGAYLVNNSILTSNQKWTIVRLLDEGTVRMPARPWLDDVQKKSSEELEQRITDRFEEIGNTLRE
jgi:hypothetical protein